MKKIATLLLLLFFCSFYGQNSGTINVEWKEKKEITYGNHKYLIPSFQIENFDFDTDKKKLSFNKKFYTNEIIEENSLTLTNVVYESISEIELGDLTKKDVPSTLKVTLLNINSRNIKQGIISFNPIINDGSGFKKIKSFNYTYRLGSLQKTTSLSNFNSISNSVLSSGKWYRFYVDKSGIYKISKNFLQSLGINTNGIDPKKIKIYGNGGRMLPLLNSAFYPEDLEENAIQVVGELDGTFDNADYILFYGEGVDNYNSDSDTHLNLYSDKSYYYVNIEGNDGKRIAEATQPDGTSNLTFTSFDDYRYYEKDLENIVKTGRRWFGEQFSIEKEQEFEFEFPNLIPSATADLKIHFGGASFNPTTFSIQNNGQNLGTVNLGSLSLDSDTQAVDATFTNALNASSSMKIKLTFDNGGVPTSKGFLDYIILKTKSKLEGTGKQFRFQNNLSATSTGIGEYQIANASNIRQVWDITDIYNVTKFENGTNATNFSFKTTLGETKKFITLVTSDFYTPKKDAQSKVTNQNLKGTIFKDAQGNFKDIDYLIISPKFLLNQAEKLANFHRSYSQLNVKVVDLETIYHEFSSGKQDVTAIRNFVKYVYQNASSPELALKYLNLFGDASFDFKNRTQNNSNIVPIYHALNSYTAGEVSFASDDFFVQLDPNEGIVENSNSGAELAVGRMIVSSTQQAEEMVNKVVEYHDIKSYGSWRNNYVSISDDPDFFKTQDKFLQFFQNRLTDIINTQKPFINYKKILLDAYQQETSAGGDRYPKAREEMLSSFEKGALVYNYLGHGGEDGLTNERIWEKSDGQNLNNQFKYPLFITITCDFSRFDNPLRPTAGEYTYWNPKGGAISMITTIRSIGQGSAQLFNDRLAGQLFSYGSNNYTSIAEALRITKIAENNNSSTRVVFYVGDPALMLAIPKPNVILTKVNDVSISQPVDDFKALSYVKLSGEVLDENNNPISNYNGELSVNIFDKEYNQNTFRNDNADAVVDEFGNEAPTMQFKTMGETIFRGNASVVNGKFEFGFVVPKDIKIPLGNGKVSFYAKRSQVLLDKTGFNTQIKVGGINTNAAVDNTAPKVRLYMNDETFVNGGITNASPFLLAFLDDENGINTASGIGHDMIAILDGDETNPYVVNDYYETELDNYKKGKIRFPFRNLTKGLHTITFKAWDVYNNFVTSEIQFLVVDEDNVSLTNVLNYPNPFVSYTQFWFTHNKPFETLEVQVQIMTITGKIVKTINQSVLTEGFLSREITWDGRDDFGDKIGKGVYIYKLTVKSTVTNKKSEKIEKLVIL